MFHIHVPQGPCSFVPATNPPGPFAPVLPARLSVMMLADLICWLNLAGESVTMPVTAPYPSRRPSAARSVGLALSPAHLRALSHASVFASRLPSLSARFLFLAKRLLRATRQSAPYIASLSLSLSTLARSALLRFTSAASGGDVIREWSTGTSHLAKLTLSADKAAVRTHHPAHKVVPVTTHTHQLGEPKTAAGSSSSPLHSAACSA